MSDIESFIDKHKDLLKGFAVPEGTKAMPSSHWITELIRTIQECRSENSDQRFGQLLFNLVALADGGRPEGYDENFHSRLFNLRDEELVKILKNYHEKGFDQ